MMPFFVFIGMSLKKWCTEHNLPFQVVEEKRVYQIGGKHMLHVKPKKGKSNRLHPNSQYSLFDEKMHFLFGSTDYDYLMEYAPLEEGSEGFVLDAVVFAWGGFYYYTNVDWKRLEKSGDFKADFNPLLYLGESTSKVDKSFHYLGVHTGAEVLNGSGKPKDWVKKAKFMGNPSLGICDRNSLAGTISFQVACLEQSIKPILGMEIVVDYRIDKTEATYPIKLYVQNHVGWINLLRLNKILKVDRADTNVTIKHLFDHSEGLVAVLPPESVVNDTYLSSEKVNKIIALHKKMFPGRLFYQLDFVEFSGAESDNNHLSSLRHYFRNIFPRVLPILIPDSYYLEKEYAPLKDFLNKVARKSYPKSSDQHYKSLSEIIAAIKPFIDPKMRYAKGASFSQIFKLSIKNTGVLSDMCNYTISTGQHKLPKYENKHGDFVDSVAFFKSKIIEGLKQRIKDGLVDKSRLPEYKARIKTEFDLISKAGFSDYFLIIWDQMNWCREQGIRYGVSRGSVGGCLLAYLLGIIDIDPIKYDLLFERFLNPTRALPTPYIVIHLDNGQKYRIQKGKLIGGKPVEEYLNGAEISSKIVEELKNNHETV
jgi:DNA polymerase-3 subunit alpha